MNVCEVVYRIEGWKGTNKVNFFYLEHEGRDPVKARVAIAHAQNKPISAVTVLGFHSL